MLSEESIRIDRNWICSYGLIYAAYTDFEIYTLKSTPIFIKLIILFSSLSEWNLSLQQNRYAERNERVWFMCYLS